MASQQVLLQDIINSIKDIMENYKEDKELKLLHQKKIDQAAAGGIEAKSYVNIKHCTDNLIRFLKSLGHKVDMEYYNDILREMYETLQALKASKNDEELLNDYKEAKCALDDFISVEVENCFKKLLSKDEVLLSDAISYINNKTLNLKIYNAKLLKRGNFR